MTDADVIDKVYAELVSLATRPEYELHTLQGSWGYKSSEGFQTKWSKMDSIIIRLAKDCSVMCVKKGKNSSGYYLFDGKIYVKVNEGPILYALELFLKHQGIFPAVKDVKLKDDFIKTINYYSCFSESRNLIAFNNGVLDVYPILRGQKPIFHDFFDPRFHVTYYHPYNYDPNAKCTKWYNFLHEVLPDKNARMILQMFLGLGLINNADIYNPYEGKDVAKVELCLLLIGQGGNGKSVIYDVARGVYGKERISGVDYDELTSPGDEGMRARVLMRGALFNWSSDSDARTFGRKRTGVFKRIVSGEAVTDREIGGNVRESDNWPYLVFSLNELPYPDDQSLGFIRRLQFVSFDVTIPKERQNKSLARELVSNYPGIFNWVVRGAMEVVRRKFIFPSSEGNRRQMLLAQLKTNPVLAWVNAYHLRWEMRAKNEIGVYMSTETLLKSLSQFCEDNEVDMVSKQKFGQTMARIGKGFFKKRFQEGYRYMVYGCDEERLKEHFVIANEDLRVDYVQERGSFISDDD